MPSIFVICKNDKPLVWEMWKDNIEVGSFFFTRESAEALLPEIPSMYDLDGSDVLTIVEFARKDQ